MTKDHGSLTWIQFWMMMVKWVFYLTNAYSNINFSGIYVRVIIKKELASLLSILFVQLVILKQI